MSEKMGEKENRPVAPLGLLRDVLRKLLQIDAQGESEEIEEIIESIVDLFFEGRFYICYDLTTGHLAFAPTPKLEAEMQQSDAGADREHKKPS